MKRIRSAFASNQVLKAHDVGDAVASGGPSNLWKIHDAVQRTPHQEVSVWVLDKKALMNSKELKKPQKEKLLEVLRKGPSKLQLLKHPQVLAVTMPMVRDLIPAQSHAECFLIYTYTCLLFLLHPPATYIYIYSIRTRIIRKFVQP